MSGGRGGGGGGAGGEYQDIFVSIDGSAMFPSN